jgi:uncharacterized protein (DUF58 family)
VSSRWLESARYAADRFRLPFRSRIWRGQVGNWAGAGSGGSIDFQDHRPYLPGDDPRHVDWQAYARSGHYVMKLYREEVSPAVDVVLDGSRSMSYEAEKKTRALELFAFVLESARRSQCAARAWVMGDDGPSPVSPSLFFEGRLDPLNFDDLAGTGARRMVLDQVPFRPGSLRVLLTDALFPDPPETLVRRLASGRGQGVVLAPGARSESSPDWVGPLDFEDCESGARRLERIDESRLAEYGARYRSHFALWKAGCRRYGVAFAQIPAEGDLTLVLRDRALSEGAVELCR